MNSTEILKSTEMDTYSQSLISSDTDLLNKVKQVIELTGCTNDIAVTTLYDSNYNIEIAIDKIFEYTQRSLVGEINKINSDWKEVAKYKKKSLEINPNESNVNIDVTEITDNKMYNDKPRPVRGNGRGRARFTQNYNRNYESFNNKSPNYANDDLSDMYGNKSIMSRGRGRRSQYRLNSNRGRTRPYMSQENNIFDGNIDGDPDTYLPGVSNKWNSSYDPCNDWLSDNTVKSNDGTESDKPFSNHYDEVSHHSPNSALKIDKFDSNLVVESCIEPDKPDSVLKDESKVLNPLDLVAKCTNKVDIFGGFSRTKPPTPSTRVPLEPVKLLTATGGVMSAPVKSGFNFSFGLNFHEYSSQSAPTAPSGTGGNTSKFIDSSESFISKIISNQNQPIKTSKSPLSLIASDNRADDFLPSNSSFPDKESQLASSSNLRISCDKSSPSAAVPNAASAVTIIKSSKPDVGGGNSSKPTDLLFSGSTPTGSHQRQQQQQQQQQHHSGEMISDKKKLLPDPLNAAPYKLPECVSNNHQSLNTTILSSSSQLCPPPGMSNAHFLQQFQSNPQYFSLLNLSNGSSIFSGCNMNPSGNDLPDSGVPSDDSSSQQAFLHSDPGKEFTQKLSNPKQHTIGANVVQPVPANSSSANHAQSPQVILPKASDSENPGGPHSSAILSAMTMSNICCFPQVYMNTYANFMPTVPGGHSSSSQSTEVVSQSSVPNKPIYNLPIAHRNYQLSDEIDDIIQSKPKFQRSQNYVTNFSGKSSQDDVGGIEVIEKSTKLPNNAQVNRQSSQSQNMSSSNRSSQQQQQQQQQQQHQVQQQSVSNDPRFLAFHHQHSNHPYQSNMFNCVTATGAHPTAHPYAMAHQGGGLQQLHPQLQLMQQQMHNFPQSYQFPEHMMTPMVSNPSSRSNISQGSGSSGNQSRSNRTNNQLWHP